MPAVHLSWSQAPMLYSSLLYQHHTGASIYQFAHQRTSGIIIPKIFSLSILQLHNFKDGTVLTGYLSNLLSRQGCVFSI